MFHGKVKMRGLEGSTSAIKFSSASEDLGYYIISLSDLAKAIQKIHFECRGACDHYVNLLASRGRAAPE